MIDLVHTWLEIIPLFFLSFSLDVSLGAIRMRRQKSLYEPEAMEDSKEMVFCRHHRTGTPYELPKTVAAHKGSTQIQGRWCSCTERRKWTWAPTPNQEAMCNWYILANKIISFGSCSCKLSDKTPADLPPPQLDPVIYKPYSSSRPTHSPRPQQLTETQTPPPLIGQRGKWHFSQQVILVSRRWTLEHNPCPLPHPLQP